MASSVLGGLSTKLGRLAALAVAGAGVEPQPTIAKTRTEVKSKQTLFFI
jgi:hypothetical protein